MSGTVPHRSDIAVERVHAQIEVFLSWPKKLEAMSIAWRRGLYVGCPDDSTLGLTGENNWSGAGEGYPRPDLYQLYRAADRDLSPAR